MSNLCVGLLDWDISSVKIEVLEDKNRILFLGSPRGHSFLLKKRMVLRTPVHLGTGMEYQVNPMGPQKGPAEDRKEKE